MSKCFKELDYLYYVDNEMEMQEREAIERHLQTCKKCSKYIDEEIKNNIKIAESFNSDHEPENFILRINEKISLDESSRKNKKRSLIWGLTAAAAIFIIIIINTVNIDKTDPSKTIIQEKQHVLLSHVNIEGKQAKIFQFVSNDIDKKYFWLKKINDNREGKNESKN